MVTVHVATNVFFLFLTLRIIKLWIGGIKLYRDA